MSTLSGIASKGEKGKSKFASIDINSLYRTSRGESLEQHQLKNTIPRKHGMQSLGKVPSARRPPANLPSLKSEHSGSDPAVSLVPSGGSGWATTKDPVTSTTNTTSNTSTPSSISSDTNTSNTTSTQCATGAAPSTASPVHPPLPGQQNTSQTTHATAPSWSAIMSRPGDVGGPVVAAVVGYAGLVGGGRGGRGSLGLSFLAHQSPQFQHEFPSLSGQPSVSTSTQSQTQQSSTTTPSTNPNAISLAAQQSLLPQQSQSHSHSAGDGTTVPQQQSQQNNQSNAQYGPGPSLRPQTEGSWVQGGSRIASGAGTGAGQGNGNTPGVPGPPHIGIAGITAHGESSAGGRPNLGQSLPMGMGQAGPNNASPSGPNAASLHQVPPNMQHYRGLIPPFMFRGNFPGAFPSQFPPNVGGANAAPRPRFNYPQERFPAPPRQQDRERPPPPADEELITRPIIKEEDLTKMDDISRDAGWAAHDDIDYNQKLFLSDDDEAEPSRKKQERKEPREEKREEIIPIEEKEKSLPRDRDVRDVREPRGGDVRDVRDVRETRDNRDNRDVRESRDVRENREQVPTHRGSWNQGPQQPAPRDFRATNGPVNYPPQQSARNPLRGVEDEEMWSQRRREQVEKLASTVERARQRKEEEERRFQEATKQGAAKKLQSLEQKMKEKHVKLKEDEPGSPSEVKSSGTPTTSAPAPEWERENRDSRERDRSRTSSEGKDEKPASRESRDSRDSRDSRESRDNREIREVRDNREGRENRDFREPPVSDFRQITQIERPSFMRQPPEVSRKDRERDRDRDQREMRERDQPAFSKNFQNDLPPRFQKQQAERTAGGVYNRVSPNADRPNAQPIPFSQQYDPSRWVHSNHPNMPGTGKKQSHSMPQPPRRNRTDSELSGPVEDERPPSRDHRGGLSRDDRYRHSSHRSYEGRDIRDVRDTRDARDGRKPSTGSYYDDYPRYRDYEYDERHSRDSWEREKPHYDERDRDGRDNREREKKDYDNYSKDTFDERERDREPPRERSDNPEWREDRRDAREERIPQDQRPDNRRETPRDDRGDRTERVDRGERPQRPDSRDSRASRESRTSLRDEEAHKSRDCGPWVNEISDYEDKKRDLHREDNRERERDRRQPPGPVTREKIEADELKGEKRSLTQLKRTGSEIDRKDIAKDSMTEIKKEPDAWNRKLERTPDNGRSGERGNERIADRGNDRGGDNSSKAWADAVSPTFELEMEDNKAMIEASKDDKEVEEMKQSLEKLSVDGKREDSSITEGKDDPKEEKRDKNVRNRTNSGSSRARDSGRSARQWGGYSVYNTRGWRSGESRGRRGGPRASGRPGSARSGSYGHTDSELSGDEVSGSTESGKEERRPPRSPKPSQKLEKEDRNREVSRREEKRGGGGEYSQARGEKRGYEGRTGREGFAPSGEPSRRGRGGFRNRGPATGRRMEGYGPPSSKSPFSTERNPDDKEPGGQKPSTPTPDNEHGAVTAQTESFDDKIMAKQQALTAGITGRHAKSPSRGQQSNKDLIQPPNQNAMPRGSQGRKEESSRSKRNHSSGRRAQTKEHREGRFRGNASNVPKQNSSDVGNEDWETTSENSEEHIDDRRESRSSRNKGFSSRGSQGSHQNLSSSNQQFRRNEPPSSNRDQRGDRNSKAPSNASSRAPGAEKRNAQNASYNNQRNHQQHAGSSPAVMQGAQLQNGRPRSQGSANAPSSKGVSKDNTVNRVDEIKLNDPNLVNQALSDMNKKSSSKESKKIPVDATDAEGNNYSGGPDDGANSNEDRIDADGFQEVRSKKNVKESRHSQKEEIKPPSRREKEKERERDRSKSKSNGPQPAAQQIQNIPALLGQPIPAPAHVPQKQFDRERNPNRTNIAPRFIKARLAKQQQQIGMENAEPGKGGNPGGYQKDSAGGPAPPPSVNAWDKPFTSQMRSNSPVPADIQLMSGLSGHAEQNHEGNEQTNSRGSSHRNSPNAESAKPSSKDADKNVGDGSSAPVQTLIFENTNYSKSGKDMAIKAKFNHVQKQGRDKRADVEDEGQMQQHQHQQHQQQHQQHQQQALSAVFANKSNEMMKDKAQEPIEMPLSFNKNEDSADMKLDFTFDSELSQLTDDAKTKPLGLPRSMHMTGAQSTISPSTAELNLKIASVKKVWENAPPMPTVVEHDDGSVVASANSFPQPFESNDVDDSYSPHQQYNQNNMKNEIATSTNVCKLVPPQVKPQQQSAGSGGVQPGSTVPGPSPIGPGQSPIGHPSASLQGPLSPPPFNSTGQPSHMNYQEFPPYPGSQAAQYGGMSAIPSPPAVLFNNGSQLPAQAGSLYGAFQLDQSRSPFTQYPPYAQSLQNSYNQQNVYLQQPPPPPHPPSATPDMYQNNMSQYRLTAAAAPPFGQNQQLSNNPNTVLISSSSNSLMSASVKPSTQPIGAIGTKAPHFQAPSAPQPNQVAYMAYDPSQVLGVSGSYMSNSQLVQRQGPSVPPSANSYYSATSAGKPNTLLYVFPGSQTGFYQPGGAAQQTGTHYGLQGFGQHNQSLPTGNATPVGLQNFGSQFLSGSGLQMAAAAAAQQYRNSTGGLPGPGNATATFLGKHQQQQQQEQSRQLKSPSGNQQDVLASVFSSTSQIPSPKSRNCKQQTPNQQPQPSPTQIHKFQQYQGVTQSALVLQQNVRGMGMPPPRAGIQPSQQRYPSPIQRPAPFPPGPNPNQSQQQPNCMPNQQQQQAQINRHRPNIHQQQQQQQQRNMKMQQQYYSSQGNVKLDSNEKSDSHNEKISDSGNGAPPGGNKVNVSQQDGENKEEVNQQNE